MRGRGLFAPSYLSTLPIEEGSVAKKAEDDKDWKYRSMTNEFHFVLFGWKPWAYGVQKGTNSSKKLEN